MEEHATKHCRWKSCTSDDESRYIRRGVSKARGLQKEEMLSSQSDGTSCSALPEIEQSELALSTTPQVMKAHKLLVQGAKPETADLIVVILCVTLLDRAL